MEQNLKILDFIKNKLTFDELLNSNLDLQSSLEYIYNIKTIDEDTDNVMLLLIYLKIVKGITYPTPSSDQFTLASLSFVDAIIDEFSEELKSDLEIISSDLTQITYKKSNIYIILNKLLKNNKIRLPENLQNRTLYCINCNDEKTFKDFVRLYPHGFYLILDE